MAKSNALTVMNLSTGEKQIYTCAPKEAVVAAYAHSLGDYNTWEYEEKYGKSSFDGTYVWICGDFCAFKDGREF
jgi:hypothetical protein